MSFFALIPVDDPSRVAEVRRVAVAAAELEGLGEQPAHELAIIATEMATNLVKYARSGEVHISRLFTSGAPGIQILSIDRGPGMDSLQASMMDGLSTAGTLGAGLGAMSRLADVFDGYSQPERGTVLVACKYPNGKPKDLDERWTFSGVSVPYPGEETCGDNWSIRRHGSINWLMVADGLGHGVFAAEASSAATASFQKSTDQSPVAMLENVHRELRSTRGAAVAVACIDHDSGTVRYAGLGNIAAVLLGGERPRFLVSHNGTAGLQARRFQEFEYPIPADATLIMHSDGLTTSWSVDAYPGLLRRHPAVIAGILYRDAIRGRDDVCVVAGRRLRECP